MLSEIINIAKKAGKIQMDFYREGFRVKQKGEDIYDLLTTADVESNKFICSSLERLFPEDYILSEENEEIPSDFSKRVWIIDPLDGTKEFVAKNGAFSIMIGLCENGTPTLGVVYAPERNELYYAQRHKGAFVEEGREKKKSLNVSKLSDIKKSRLVTRIDHGEKRKLDYLVRKIPKAREIVEGSMGLKFTLLAKGSADIFINTNYRCSKWDTCAPQIILEEAGGKVTDMNGRVLDYKQKSLKWNSSFLASNGILHKELVKNIASLKV